MTTDVRPFEDLTYRGQVARMRALARRALPRFGLRRDSPLALCGHGENTVFRTRDGGGRAYALRIHRLDYQSPESIRSEMEWLAALRRDTDIGLPVPRKGRNGQYVQRVEEAGVPGTRSCVLMRWTDGRIVGMRRSPTYWTRLGELMARLHGHGLAWKRPAGFCRRRWDEHELIGGPAFGDPLRAPGLRKPDRARFERARAQAVERLQAFGKSRRRWGLIHADLHSHNVVREGAALRPIDFDDCGFGWFLYDIAVGVIVPVWMTPAYEPTMDAFFEGYRRLRPFDEGDLAMAETFVVARALGILGWLANRQDNPALARRIPWMIERTRKVCRPFLTR